MDNYCCINCFSNSEIKRFIESKKEIGDCDYCGSQDVHIREVEEVGSFIMEGVLRYYEDAANQVSYISSEGGYQLPTSDIHEIISDEEAIFSGRLDDPTELLNDLVTNDGTPYVRKDPYGPPSGDPDEIRYWENFCKVIKTQQRFTAFLSCGEEDPYDYGLPSRFLFHLAETYMPTLIDILPKGTTIFRARINKNNQDFQHIDLTSPPSEYAKDSRMSPAGISFFYGGMDHETCIHEVRPDLAENVVVAEFETTQNLLVLDLAMKMEPRASIFNPEYNFFYEEYFKPFLFHFADEISKPLRRTDNKIEYIPAQVFTEFIKTVNFKDHFYLPGDNGKEADVYMNGMQYKSSIRKGGINIVLFRGPDISTDSPEKGKKPWLLYKGKKKYAVTDLRVTVEEEL
ncbi:MAG: RES domain-containing protein [Deltaproteobacteria bacterium]|nr:RES domain-containing protein [Deltaproteobacteria bacterium]